jgi:hypothetical protein
MKNELNKLLENRIYNHEECVSKIEELIEKHVNEKIDKLIQKIEGETLAHYAYEAVIGMLENLKF